MADGSTPTPSPTPTTSSPRPSASPTAGASLTPSPAPTDATAAATASLTPSATPDPEKTRAEAEAARARDADLLANARSLAQLIEAQARVAQDELAGLDPQLAAVATDLDAVNAEIAALQAESSRRGLHNRLERDALRLLALGADRVPPNLADAQQEALDEVVSLERALRAAQARLSERAELLATLKGSVGAKQAHLARLRDRARVLAAAAANGDTDARAAQVEVLKALAQDATNAQTALAQLVASAMVPAGENTAAWRLPVRGVLTQPFGPTTFALEPALTYRGVAYAHFHAAIDIAARLGTPVTAASDGVVAFVGHLPDGAMIVLVAHPGGYVSEYAHLDDTFALPPVRAGQPVTGGQVIGFIGLTGITTGAHLHYALLKDGVPIDPLSVIAGQ
jgi:murein DD-endopeptidase MepM/ murein hydrolase activator NlpD